MPGRPIAIALMLAAPAAEPTPAEWLAPGDRRTLDAVETSRTAYRTKIVYVGRGETAENWTRRLTIWSYPGIVLDRAAFAAEAARVRLEIIADCPGVTAGALRLFDWSGRPAAEYGIVCPLYPPTGRQDIYFVRTISGRTSRLAAAVTFRNPPTAAQTAQARVWLDGLVLCTSSSAEPACRR